MKLSIVSTMYMSAPYIEEFHERIVNSIKKIQNDNDEYEIILVNDGSPDNSLSVARELLKKDENIKIVDLSRNFGHHKAIMTGLSQTTGDYIFLIDIDLEEEPELLEIFWNELEKDKSLDVVYGVQEKRKGGIFEKISGFFFYKFVNFLSNVKVSENIVTARLMKRKYVDSLLRYNEKEIYWVGLCADAGFNQKKQIIKKLDTSATTYSLRQKFLLLFNAVVSFSNKPLIYIFNLGLFVTFLSIFYIGYLVFEKYYIEIGVDGWTTVVASIWLIGGIIIFSIGVVGLYLSKIFTEVKNRPYTIIKEIYSEEN